MNLLKFTIIIGCAVAATLGESAENSDAVQLQIEPPWDSKFDWIQLTSGEWLKGDFEVLYNDTVEFDSAELEWLEFDLEDVQQLRTWNIQTLKVETHPGSRKTREVRGQLLLNEDTIVVLDGSEQQEFGRSQIVAIAEGVEHGRNLWSGFVSVGINARSGNTETADATYMFNIKRRTAHNRFILDYIGNYSKSGPDVIVNNHRLNGTADWLLSSRTFWRALDLQYSRDPFSNIENQYSISTSAGYGLIRKPKTKWEVTGGWGYQYQTFVSVETNEADYVDTPFLQAGTRFDTEITSRADFLLDYSFRILNERSGDYTQHLLTTLSTDITRSIDVDISLIWDHIQTPQTTADGTVPEQDDYQIVFSLAYDF
jgi:hypothetical protein